jgi:hypothetical protein
MTIRGLIEAVQAGEATDFTAMLTPDVHPVDRSKRCGWAVSAYRGNLNAAAQLHRAMLPGWRWRLEEHAALVCRIKDDFTRAGCAKDPARAWLLAILRALEATQEQTP